MAVKAGMMDWPKIIGMVFVLITTSITALWTGINLVEAKITDAKQEMSSRLAEHVTRPHDGAVIRQDYSEDLALLHTRLERIEGMITQLLLRSHE